MTVLNIPLLAILLTVLTPFSAAQAFPVQDRSESDLLIPMIIGAHALSDDVLGQASARLKLPFDKAADGEVEIASVVHWMLPTFPCGIFPASRVGSRTARLPVNI